MWQTANLEALPVTDYSLAVGMMGNEARQVLHAVLLTGLLHQTLIHVSS